MNNLDFGWSPEVEFSEGLPVETQQYTSVQTGIAGCLVEEIKVFEDHEGRFSELMNRRTQGISMSYIAQLNYSLLPPNVLKGWHLHKKQTDVWFIPPGKLQVCNVGLWDTRKGSPTEGIKFKLKLHSEDKFYKITIPAGVAHGIQSLTFPVNMLYCVTEEFNPAEPDEHRIAPGVESKENEEKFWD